MTLSFLYILDWLLIALSFFNTIALLWLGLTVLLNAERRVWGTWLAGAGLLLGGVFFAIHSSIVGQALWDLDRELELWWRFGWIPFVAAPYLWYLVMAWYSGALRRGRHRAWAVLVGLLGGAALGLLVFDNPVPTYRDLLQGETRQVLAIGGLPVVLLVYPVYSVLCIVLSLAALRRPAASERFMGDVGRERARPWLVAASLVLLLVCLGAGAAFAWLLDRARTGSMPAVSARSLAALLSFDLLLSALIAVVVVLLGRAIVAYEVFTGKTLPRGGLARYWRNSLILAAGYGLLVGGSLDLPIAPVYQVLVATLLVTLFYALLSWRAFVERERSVERLRPFVASQRLYDRLLGPAGGPEADVAETFRALCDDVLNACMAYLAPLGPLAPLAGPALTFGATTTSDQERSGNGSLTPDQQPAADPASRLSPPIGLHAGDLAQLAARFGSPQLLCLPLDPRRYGGAVWAVPLWNQRGLAGVLLLGAKRDGTLYTQEEIEIARAAGERLIDTQASAELSRRLMTLQRQRLAESQILDRRTRRLLHDDVLPRLHAAMLMLGNRSLAPAARDEAPVDNLSLPSDQTSVSASRSLPPEPPDEAIALLTGIHRDISALLRELPPTTEPELAKLGLVGALRHVVSGELGRAFDRVRWSIDGDAEDAVRALPPLSAEVVFGAAREAIRNAARYGRGGDAARPLSLAVSLHRGRAVPTLQLAVEDDGVGLGAAGTSLGGSGQGLALHSTMMAVIGGTLTAESLPGGGTRVVLDLPVVA